MKIFKVAITIVVILIVVSMAYMAIMNTKTPKELGVKDGKLAKMPSSPNAVSSQTTDLTKFVEPFKYLEDFETSKAMVIKIISEFDGGKIVENEDNYIHAVFTTSTMKFNDDVEFYFDDENKVIHFRSASRVGYSDNGLNKARYTELSNLYYSK